MFVLYLQKAMVQICSWKLISITWLQSFCCDVPDTSVCRWNNCLLHLWKHSFIERIKQRALGKCHPSMFRMKRGFVSICRKNHCSRVWPKQNCEKSGGMSTNTAYLCLFVIFLTFVIIVILMGEINIYGVFPGKSTAQIGVRIWKAQFVYCREFM